MNNNSIDISSTAKGIIIHYCRSIDCIPVWVRLSSVYEWKAFYFEAPDVTRSWLSLIVHNLNEKFMNFVYFLFAKLICYCLPYTICQLGVVEIIILDRKTSFRKCVLLLWRKCLRVWNEGVGVGGVFWRYSVNHYSIFLILCTSASEIHCFQTSISIK